MATVVITGASMGIGRALALAWAARKATLVLSARGRDALESVGLEVEAWDGERKIGEGTHRRAVIDLSRFGKPPA